MFRNLQAQGQDIARNRRLRVVRRPCRREQLRVCGWAEMRAVRGGKVAYADGNLYFNRSGMTTVRTAEILGELLHGEVFGERSEGRAWQWMSA